MKIPAKIISRLIVTGHLWQTGKGQVTLTIPQAHVPLLLNSKGKPARNLITNYLNANRNRWADLESFTHIEVDLEVPKPNGTTKTLVWESDL